MKKLNKSLVLFLTYISFAFSSLTFSYAQELSTKSLELPSFTAISLETVGDLIIENDLKHKFTIEAEPEVIARISAKVGRNVLRVFATGDFQTEHPIKMKVSLSKLNEIVLSSSGDIQLGKWRTDKIDFLLFGSGSINATEVISENILAKIDGSGDITLAGQASIFRAKIDGTGTIEANNLIASSATASLNGSGDINLNVIKLLDASVVGSGTISYQGNPKLTTSIQGAGEIVKQ